MQTRATIGDLFSMKYIGLSELFLRKQIGAAL